VHGNAVGPLPSGPRAPILHPTRTSAPRLSDRATVSLRSCFFSTFVGQASRVFVRQAQAARGRSVQRKRLAAATAEGIETPGSRRHALVLDELQPRASRRGSSTSPRRGRRGRGAESVTQARRGATKHERRPSTCVRRPSRPGAARAEAVRGRNRAASTGRTVRVPVRSLVAPRP